MRATRTLIIILRHLLRTLHGTRTGSAFKPAKSDAFGSRTICMPIIDNKPESIDV